MRLLGEQDDRVNVANNYRSSSATSPDQDVHLYDAVDTTYQIGFGEPGPSWNTYRPLPYADRDGDVHMLNAISEEGGDVEMEDIHYAEHVEMENMHDADDVEMEDLDDAEVSRWSMGDLIESISQILPQSHQLDGICELDIDGPIIDYSAGITSIRPVSSRICEYEAVDRIAFEVEILNKGSEEPIQRPQTSNMSPRTTSMSLSSARTGTAARTPASRSNGLCGPVNRPSGSVRRPMRCIRTVTLEYRYEEICAA